MNAPLEDIYAVHHKTRRGEGFVLLGDERGAYLRAHVGTGKNVLDIGCRDGALTKMYMEGNTVLGLDIDSSALSRAQILGIETRQVDLNGPWGVETGAYDAVVAAEVVEHIYYPEQVLDKAADVLKSGGVFVGTVPNAFSLIHRMRYLLKQKRGTPLSDPTHINHFTVVELRTLMKKRFVDVEVAGIGRLGWFAKAFPQTFAYDLCFSGKKR